MRALRSKARISKVTRLTLGAILIATGVLLVGSTPVYKFYINSDMFNPTPAPSSLLSVDPILIEESLLKQKYSEADLPDRVIIPSISVDVEVKSAKVINGRWEVFEDTGSFGLGSALPGEKGNSVMFAHAREGLFLPLRKISTGETIYILTQNKWHEYKVTEVREVSPRDTSVIGQTVDETLTLYTCSGFADSKRLIVVAKKI